MQPMYVHWILQPTMLQFLYINGKSLYVFVGRDQELEDKIMLLRKI